MIAPNDRTFFDELDDIERIEVDENEISEFTSEDDFIALGVSLLIEAGSYVCVAAGTMGDAPSWDRDRAVVGGNVVRLYKLVSAILDQTVKRRRETSFVFARLGFETVVTIRFLVKHFSPELLKSYMQNSLRHEARLRKKVEESIAARNRVVLPIEDRMLKSIDRSFATAGLTPDDLHGYQERNWGGKNLHEKATDLGMEDVYLGAFAGPSHNIHGAWGDIYAHNLETEGDGTFHPKIAWGRPRPQLLNMMAKLVIPALDDYCAFIAGPEVNAEVQPKLADLWDRITVLEQAHEAYLGEHEWPNINAID